MGSIDVCLVEVSKLLPIEDHSKKRSLNIEKKIKTEKVWSKPIVVEKNHMLVLDGHHRFSFAKREGLKKIPAVLVDYSDIDIRSLRKEISFTKDDVVKNALQEKIYPYKTVKHDLNFRLPEIHFRLEELL